jgi:hypothetical protein
MEELSRNNPIPRGDVAAGVVMNAYNNTLDANNVGRLGVLLARYTFVGDELPQESLLKGKSKRPGLDPKVLNLLVAAIHNRHPFSMMTLSDFRNTIRPEIERALIDFLKPNPPKRSVTCGVFLSPYFSGYPLPVDIHCLIELYLLCKHLSGSTHFGCVVNGSVATAAFLVPIVRVESTSTLCTCCVMLLNTIPVENIV